MGAALHRAAGTSPLKNIRVNVGGATHGLKHGFIRTKAGLQSFFGSFAVTLSTDEVVGHGYGKPSGAVQSSPVTAAAAGNGPFTYSWARTDGGPHTIEATNPASAGTAFRSTVGAGQAWTATFACTVTDASGQSVTTGNVAVSLENDSL